MTSWIALRNKLAEGLRAAFTVAELRRLVSVYCERDLEDIVSERSNRVEVIELVLRSAERKGWLELLLHGARELRPAHDVLIHLITQIEAQIARQGNAFYLRSETQASRKGGQRAGNHTVSTVADSSGVVIGDHSSSTVQNFTYNYYATEPNTRLSVVEAEELLASLPLTQPPQVGHIPAFSRGKFRANKLFVGRETELCQLAAALLPLHGQDAVGG